jgi:arabinogalactan endo-1,4-beta-galactosidase
MKILVDFFYSDWWADPEQQWLPAGWTGSSDDIWYHTTNVLNAMKNASGCGTPDMVQVGNEVNGGMLWPAAEITWNPNNFSNFVSRANAGYDAVKSVSGNINVMIHYAGAKGNGFDAPWWFGAYAGAGGKLDVIGISYYPMWHGSISNAVNALNSLASHGKDTYIVETASYWTNSDTGESTPYPQTKQGQYNFLYDLTNSTKNINRFKGIFYWGATWAQTDEWLHAPGWSDDARTRALFDTPGGATANLNMAADAMSNAGGLSVRGVDISEARYAEQNGVTYAD